MKTSNRRSDYRCLTFAAAVVTTAAVFSSSVAAADLPVKSRADIAVRPLWSGYYVGFHGGWGWSSTRVEDSVFFTPTDPWYEGKSNGPLAGAQLGANWQHGNVVVGAEIDGSWASLRGNFNRDQSIPSTGSQPIHIRALATATGRVGYAMGTWLAYAKAGAAWAQVKLTTGSLGPQPVVYDRSWFGATAGAGMEVALLRNVSAKIEYNFLYLPAHDLAFNHPDSTASIDHFVHVVKGGFNVRFGGDHVVAR